MRTSLASPNAIAKTYNTNKYSVRSWWRNRDPEPGKLVNNCSCKKLNHSGTNFDYRRIVTASDQIGFGPGFYFQDAYLAWNCLPVFDTQIRWIGCISNRVMKCDITGRHWSLQSANPTCGM